MLVKLEQPEKNWFMFSKFGVWKLLKSRFVNDLQFENIFLTVIKDSVVKLLKSIDVKDTQFWKTAPKSVTWEVLILVPKCISFRDVHPSKAWNSCFKYGAFKLLKSKDWRLEQPKNIWFKNSKLLVWKFSKLTEIKELHPLNIIAILPREFAFLFEK